MLVDLNVYRMLILSLIFDIIILLILKLSFIWLSSSDNQIQQNLNYLECIFNHLYLIYHHQLSFFDKSCYSQNYNSCPY